MGNINSALSTLGYLLALLNTFIQLTKPSTTPTRADLVLRTTLLVGKIIHNVGGLACILGPTGFLLVFGLLCCLTASPPITSGTHTSGAQ